MAVQDGPTSVLVSWSPPTPLGDTTGYIISYTGGSGAIISGGSTESYHLSRLHNGATYIITVVATSQHLPSDAVVTEITLGETTIISSMRYNKLLVCSVTAPGQPSVSVTSITAASISLSWSVPISSVVTSYEVMLKEAGSGATETSSGILTDTRYTIQLLNSRTIYTISVTATNPAGSAESTPILISTGNIRLQSRP